MLVKINAEKDFELMYIYPKGTYQEFGGPLVLQTTLRILLIPLKKVKVMIA